MKTRHLEIAGFCGLMLFLIYLNLYPKQNEKALKKAQAQNHYYEIVNRQQDSLLNEVLTFLNRFEENLDSVRMSENLIYDLDRNGEKELNFQERMFEGLEQIRGHLVSNRDILDSLENRSVRLGYDNAELRATIARLSDRLKQKALAAAELEQSLARAHGRIKSLGTKVHDLESNRQTLIGQTQRLRDTLDRQKTTISTQGKYIRSQEAELQKGYLISGNLKELRKSGVIDISGGVAGIGTVVRLANDMNQEEFVPVDIKHLTIIPFSGQKVKLVSPHPMSAYRIVQSHEGNPVSRLEITDPEVFWSTSKYLVVLTR